MKNIYFMLHRKFGALLDNLYFDNWLIAILQRVFFRRENLIVYRKEKLTILIDFAGGDAAGTRSCLTSTMYSRYFTYFDRRRPLTVLDLGANGGGFPLSLVLTGFTFSKLVCVEMNRNTYTRLCFNLNYNFPRNIVAINAAVAGRTGRISLPVTPGGTNESIDRENMNAKGELTEIATITLDDLVHEQFGEDDGNLIDVCKMDVERAEYDVFHSPACLSIRRMRYLIVEIHPHKTYRSEDLIDKIGSFGFEGISGEIGDGGAGVYLFRNAKIRE